MSTKSAASFLGLVQLKGSTRQCEWAEKIRAAIISDCTGEQFERLRTLPGAQLARFWIDNKDEDVPGLLGDTERARVAVALAKAKIALAKAEQEGKPEQANVLRRWIKTQELKA